MAWSASYAYSRSEDRIEGRWLPRPHDQRHATHLHLAVRPTSAWTITAAWQARSGWPASEQRYEVVTLATGDPVVGNFFGDLYQLRLLHKSRPDTHRKRIHVSQNFT